jgi:hypothetical protein
MPRRRTYLPAVFKGKPLNGKPTVFVRRSAGRSNLATAFEFFMRREGWNVIAMFKDYSSLDEMRADCARVEAGERLPGFGSPRSFYMLPPGARITLTRDEWVVQRWK